MGSYMPMTGDAMYKDDSGLVWRIERPSTSSTGPYGMEEQQDPGSMWEGYIMQASHGHAANTKQVIADDEKGLLLAIDAWVTEQEIQAREQAPKSKSGGGWLWLLVLGGFYVLEKNTKRRRR
jgi:hypothetical protein